MTSFHDYLSQEHISMLSIVETLVKHEPVVRREKTMSSKGQQPMGGQVGNTLENKEDSIPDFENGHHTAVTMNGNRHAQGRGEILKNTTVIFLRGKIILG